MRAKTLRATGCSLRLRRLRIARRAALVVALAQVAVVVPGVPLAPAQANGPNGNHGTRAAPYSIADHYVGTHFTPQLSVKTSTNRAGAHPDLELTIRKTPNHCLGQSMEPWQPWQSSRCSANEVYLEQDFKDQTIHLPAGLLGDVNAAPQCTAIRDYLRDYSSDIGPFAGWGEGQTWSMCPPESQVGVVSVGHPYLCQWYALAKRDPSYFCSDWSVNNKITAGGLIYNGVPEPGEQARFYMVVGYCGGPEYPGRCDPRKGLAPDGVINAMQVLQISIKLRAGSDWGLDAIARDVPDALCLFYTWDAPSTWCPPMGEALPTPYAFDDVTITFFGQTGANRGHPLMLNPTSCQGREVAGSFRGYAQNVWWSVVDQTGNPRWNKGSGDGMTAESSVPYPVTGCNSLPYDPKLSLSLDPAGPGQPAAITSTVTQAVGEQTTKHVEVRMPRSFKVNFANRLAQCSADQAAARSCPREAKVGDVTAETSLLPETGDFAGPLRGEVFIGETTATDIKLYVLLHGFVEATLQGSVTMNADGSSRVSFDLPEVPQQKITLSLLGGMDKGLVTTPKTCGTHTLDATFTSHQGTERTLKVPVEVSCTDPTFDVGLSTRRPRAHPTLDLTTGSSGLSSVRFDLPAGLKVAHRPGRLKTLGSYGALSLKGEGVPSELKLKLLGVGRKGQLSFTGTEAGAALTSLAGKRVSLGGRKRAHGKSSSRPLRLNVGDLPSGTTGVSLELAGKRDGLLQNPSACHTRGRGQKLLKLGFTAHIVTTDGKAHTLHQTVAMSCLGSSHGRGR